MGSASPLYCIRQYCNAQAQIEIGLLGVTQRVKGRVARALTNRQHVCASPMLPFQTDTNEKNDSSPTTAALLVQPLLDLRLRSLMSTWFRFILLFLPHRAKVLQRYQESDGRARGSEGVAQATLYRHAKALKAYVQPSDSFGGRKHTAELLLRTSRSEWKKL